MFRKSSMVSKEDDSNVSVRHSYEHPGTSKEKILYEFWITPDTRGLPDDPYHLALYLGKSSLAEDIKYYEKVTNKEDVKIEGSANKQTGVGGPYVFRYGYEDPTGKIIRRTQHIYIKAFHPAEKLSADIQNAIFPGKAASVLRIMVEGKPYDGSIIFDQIKFGYVVLHEEYNKKYPEKKVSIPKSREKRAGTGWNNIVAGGLTHLQESKTGEFYDDETLPYIYWGLSLFLGNFDIHWANVGTIAVSKSSGMSFINSLEALCRAWRFFDFGWCLAKLDKAKENYFDPITDETYTEIAQLHIHSHSKHLPLSDLKTQPTNHFTEIPDDILFTEKFALVLDKIANTPRKTLADVVAHNFLMISESLGLEGLKKLAEHIKTDMDKQGGLQVRLNTILKARQAMCRELAFIIRLSVCVNESYKLDETKLEKLLKEHPEYALYIQARIKNPRYKLLKEDEVCDLKFAEEVKPFHFRGSKILKKNKLALSKDVVKFFLKNRVALLSKAGEAKQGLMQQDKVKEMKVIVNLPLSSNSAKFFTTSPTKEKPSFSISPKSMTSRSSVSETSTALSPYSPRSSVSSETQSSEITPTSPPLSGRIFVLPPPPPPKSPSRNNRGA